MIKSILLAVLALSVTVTINAAEQLQPPESFRLQQTDQLLQESIIANLLCLEDSELSPELYELEQRALSVSESARKQSLTAHLMNGTEPAAQLRTFGADGMCVMLDVAVLAQACKEAAGMAGPDGDEGAKGKDGKDSRIAASVGRSMSDNPIPWAVGAVAAVAGTVKAIDNQKSDPDPAPATDSSGSTSIDASNNTGTLTINYTGDDSAAQAGDDTGKSDQ